MPLNEAIYMTLFPNMSQTVLSNTIMIGLWVFSRLLIDMYFELLESTDIFNGIKKRNANVL